MGSHSSTCNHQLIYSLSEKYRLNMAKFLALLLLAFVIGCTVAAPQFGEKHFKFEFLTLYRLFHLYYRLDTELIALNKMTMIFFLNESKIGNQFGGFGGRPGGFGGRPGGFGGNQFGGFGGRPGGSSLGFGNGATNQGAAIGTGTGIANAP